jgi:hypothetical protein
MDYREQARDPFFSKQTLGRIILFSLFIFFTAVFQSSFFGAAGVFPATPDMLLAAVMGIALFDGERSGSLCGMLAGVLANALGSPGTAFMPVFYMLAGFLTGIAIRSFLSRNLLSWLVYVLIGGVLRGSVTLMYVMITEKVYDTVLILTKVVLPEAVMTLIFSVPVYFLARLCARPFLKETDLE